MSAYRNEIKLLEEAISQASGISIEDMLGRSRKPEIVDARHAVWFVAFRELGYSSPELGIRYGRDHTSILHGVRKIEESDHAPKIIEGISRLYPGLLDRIRGPRRGRSIDKWDFEQSVDKV